jgi:hypothetical protein
MEASCFLHFLGSGSFGMRIAIQIAHVLISMVSFQDRKKEQKDEEFAYCSQCCVGTEFRRFK